MKYQIEKRLRNFERRVNLCMDPLSLMRERSERIQAILWSMADGPPVEYTPGELKRADKIRRWVDSGNVDEINP